MSRTNPKNAGELLMYAAVDCEHSIDIKSAKLGFDPSKPGNNALNQLEHRLEAAFPRAVAMFATAATTSALDRAALALALKAAQGMRDSAAHDGHYNDGGAGHLEALCNAYECGLSQRFPEFLRPYVEQADREADAEYAEYKRLHAKFGGKA